MICFNPCWSPKALFAKVLRGYTYILTAGEAEVTTRCELQVLPR